MITLQTACNYILTPLCKNRKWLHKGDATGSNRSQDNSLVHYSKNLSTISLHSTVMQWLSDISLHDSKSITLAW